MSPDDALGRLKEGNRRYLSGRGRDGVSGLTRGRLVEGQEPFACVLGCADSRVPVELLFDVGPGELFVVRVAGNVTSPEVSASVEYAVAHLGVQLVLVLGHQGCGAVAAALAGLKAPGNIATLLQGLAPPLEGLGPRDLEEGVRRNVHHVVAELRADEPVLAEAVRAGRCRIVPAVYHLRTGQVDVLGAE